MELELSISTIYIVTVRLAVVVLQIKVTPYESYIYYRSQRYRVSDTAAPQREQHKMRGIGQVHPTPNIICHPYTICIRTLSF